MNIHEVENMSADELKAGQAEIVKALDGNAELAVRYVQARLDAKIRDEKLAEQAKTLEALQIGLEAAKGQVDESNAQAALWHDKTLHLDMVMAEKEQQVKERLARLQAGQQISDKMIGDLRARCDRLKATATEATNALANVYHAAMGASAEIQSAAARAIKLAEIVQADEGE